MSDYKPLTDEEIAALQEGKYGYDPHWRRMDRLVQQARRANALAEAAREFHGNLGESIYTENCPVCKALAAYLGETDD